MALKQSKAADQLRPVQDGAGNAIEIVMQGATASFGAPLGNLTCAAGADAACNVSGVISAVALVLSQTLSCHLKRCDMHRASPVLEWSDFRSTPGP